MLPELFRPIEEDQQQKIREGTAPFLSLFAEQLLPDTRRYIKGILSVPRLRRTSEDVIEGLYEWPALMSMHLTAELNAGLSDKFRIYPHIEKAFGVTFATQAERKQLWQAFRMACTRLGLTGSPRLSGTHYMVTEYVRQMGVPLAYAGELARRMQRLGDKIGLPDKDDPASLRLWRGELLQCLSVPFPGTARQAIEFDHQGYYIQLFLDLLHTESPETPFEQKMLEGLQGSAKSPRRSLGVPRVVFHEDVLGVLLPTQDQKVWVIQVDGDRIFQGTGGEDRFVPLDAELPREVRVSDGTNAWEYNLWADDKTSRILLFGDTDSRFQQEVTFGPDDVAVTPGTYVLLTRFVPRNDDLETVQIGQTPDVFATRLHVLPGESLEIQRGPALLRLMADAMPMVQLLGRCYQDQEGKELLAGLGLGIRVTLPEEYLGKALRLRVRSRSLGDPLEIRLDGRESVQDIDAEKLLEAWKSGVSLITVDCLPAEGNRVLARTASLVWNGLRRMENGRFLCARLPENLDEQRSENVQADEEEGDYRLAIKENENRVWRLAFVDGNRDLISTWARPGLYMRLRSYGEDGVMERALRQDENLSLADGQRDVLFVHGLGAGRLRLGDQAWDLLGNRQFWRAPLATLRDAVTPRSSTLIYENTDGGAVKELLHFVTPQHCTEFKTQFTPDHVLMSFQTHTSPEQVVFHAENLVTGAKAALHVDRVPESGLEESFSQGGACVVFLSETKCLLKLQPDGWPDGLWRIQAGVQCQGQYGVLSNARLDEFCCLLPIQENRLVKPKELMEGVSRLPLADQGQFFERLHCVLLRCHAQEAWGGMDWLSHCWRTILHLLTANSEEPDATIRQVLLNALTMIPPQEAAPGWVPLLQIIAERPSLLAWEGVRYRDVRTEDGYFARCLARMGDLWDSVLAVKYEILHPAVGMAWMQGPNQPEVMIPQYFQVWPMLDMEDRRRCLLDENWTPGAGEYLGPLHYRYAVRRLLENHQRAVHGQGNPMRRSWASLLCKKAALVNVFSNQSLPIKGREWDPLTRYGLEAWPEESDMFELAVGCSCFLAGFAFFCRAEAHGGSQANSAIQEYLKRLAKGTAMEPTHARIGSDYLLAVGRELLGFYLLFWEWLFMAGLKPKDL